MQNENIDNQDRLLTFDETARMLGLSVRTFYQARTVGQLLLPVVQLSPRNLRIRLSDVMAVMRGERAVMGAPGAKQ